jgi:hypothetical protein
MGARFRLTASGLAVATALCAGAAAGRVVGPLPPAGSAPPATDGTAHDTGDGAHGAHLAGARAPAGAADPAGAGDTEGLLARAAGYTFVADSTLADGVAGTPFRFRITDPAGAVVHDYSVVHERLLHLVIVSRDLLVYHHLHPMLGPDGTWTVPLPALRPGAYRVFADFAVAGGPALTLGLDLLVPGGTLYSPLPPPTGLVAVDGYDVSLTGAPVLAGGDSGDGGGGEVALTIARGGAPITDLEPYLGELGHLVVIRSSDLAFVHVHPVDTALPAAGPGTGAGTGAGPTVRFHAAVGAPGRYRMFFEFVHAGIVHTAAFTADVPPPPP